MKLDATIFKGFSNAGKPKKTSVELYGLAESLYDILDRNGLVAELKETSLLGSIKVNKKNLYTRYDYVVLQLYIFKLVKGGVSLLKGQTLNSAINSADLEQYVVPGHRVPGSKVTIADVLQVLAFVSNIGHFKNTFTASRAAIAFLRSNPDRRMVFINQFQSPKHQLFAQAIIDDYDYRRFHLLNSLIVLINLQADSATVQFAVNVLSAYISNTDDLPERLKSAFQIFKVVRKVSFVACDLAIAPLPIYLNLYNDKHLILLLKELLPGYKENAKVSSIFEGATKLLQDYVYNESASALIQQSITDRMVRSISQSQASNDIFRLNYPALIHGLTRGADHFNMFYSKIKDVDQKILKFAVQASLKNAAVNLAEKLNRMNYTRATWYDSKDERLVVVLVALKKNCQNKTWQTMRIVKAVLSFADKIKNELTVFAWNDIVLLATKYLLYYLFADNDTLLDGKLDKNNCIIYARGTKNRVKQLRDLIKKSDQVDEDDLHEMKVLLSLLESEDKNDAAIIVTAGIEVTCVNDEGRNMQLAEFDGLIIFPNRKKEQVVFSEAKNKKRPTKESVPCLVDKFAKLKVEYDIGRIIPQGNNCYYKYTIAK